MTADQLPCTAGVSELAKPALTVVPEDVADQALTVDELGSRIVGLAGRLASAMCRWLLLVAEFDARDGAARSCLPSTARWLGHYCGLSGRTAREHVRTARALAAHPLLADAMNAGRISYSHVRAITRVAELGDSTLVEKLVMVAEHGTVGQLEDVVRGLRTVEDNNQEPTDRREERLSHRWRDDSHWGLSAKLAPEHGALVQSAIETVARREGVSHAQALTRLAEIALATLNTSDRPAPSLRGGEYAAIVIHLDESAVPIEPAAVAPEPEQGGSAAPPAGDDANGQRAADRNSRVGPEGGPAEPPPPALPSRPYARIVGGPGLPDGAVKRLLCTGRIRTVVTTGSGGAGRVGPYGLPAGVLDIGANRRLVSDKQFRALLLRDGGCCTFPGCGSGIGLEAHHVQHWIYGGKTIMANLVLLCRGHHHALHERDFRIVARRNQRFRFYRADGVEIPRHIDPSRLSATGLQLEDEHAHVAPTAATTRWDGTRLEHDYAVTVLAQGLRSA